MKAPELLIITRHRSRTAARSLRAALFALLLASTATPQLAQSASGVMQSGEQRWRTECSSCHIAYPPKLLSAPTWGRMMSGLDKHFGADATVEPAAAAEIVAYLEQNARGKRAEPTTTLRITDTRWFQREHDEVPAGVWKRPAVKSASNCGACHTAADSGDFRERNIRIPR